MKREVIAFLLGTILLISITSALDVSSSSGLQGNGGIDLRPAVTTSSGGTTNNYYNNTYVNGSSYNATYDLWAYNQSLFCNNSNNLGGTNANKFIQNYTNLGYRLFLKNLTVQDDVSATNVYGRNVQATGSNTGNYIKYYQDGSGSWMNFEFSSTNGETMTIFRKASGQSAKNFYFGEDTDTGGYIFRGGKVTGRGGFATANGDGVTDATKWWCTDSGSCSGTDFCDGVTGAYNCHQWDNDVANCVLSQNQCTWNDPSCDDNPCNSFGNQGDCESQGCTWYTPSSYTDRASCTAITGFSWGLGAGGCTAWGNANFDGGIFLGTLT